MAHGDFQPRLQPAYPNCRKASSGRPIYAAAHAYAGQIIGVHAERLATPARRRSPAPAGGGGAVLANGASGRPVARDSSPVKQAVSSVRDDAAVAVPGVAAAAAPTSAAGAAATPAVPSTPPGSLRTPPSRQNSGPMASPRLTTRGHATKSQRSGVVLRSPAAPPEEGGSITTAAAQVACAAAVASLAAAAGARPANVPARRVAAVAVPRGLVLSTAPPAASPMSTAAAGAQTAAEIWRAAALATAAETPRANRGEPPSSARGTRPAAQTSNPPSHPSRPRSSSQRPSRYAGIGCPTTPPHGGSMFGTPRTATPRMPVAQQVTAVVTPARGDGMSGRMTPRFQPRRQPGVPARATIAGSVATGVANGGIGQGTYTGGTYYPEAIRQRGDQPQQQVLLQHQQPPPAGSLPQTPVGPASGESQGVAVAAAGVAANTAAVVVEQVGRSERESRRRGRAGARARTAPREKKNDAGRPNIRTCQQALRTKVIMRQLNESASWFSDVGNESEPSDDERKGRRRRTAREGGSKGAIDGGGQPIFADGRCLCLAEIINESATWIDADLSESDREEQPPPMGVQMAAAFGPGRLPPRSFSY